MKIFEKELEAVWEVLEQETEVVQLSELQLAFVGGGAGDVVFH